MNVKNHELDLPGYGQWLSELKKEIQNAQQRAARAVNHELITLYWRIGRDILDRQKNLGWGAKVIQRLAEDLRAAFPQMRGFSRANLLYMRAFADAWTKEQIVQQAVGQLPWGHNLVLLSKLKDTQSRIAYARLTVEYGWSRNALVHHIEMQTANRIGAAQNNFPLTLPKPQSDLAVECLKDPYKLDFLDLDKQAQEREIERTLALRVSDFLLELGSGFAFVGKQVHLEVGGDDFYIDLLFYHIRLHCYFVIELKATDFKPEQLGQLSFYIAAVDRQMRGANDAPTIGLLLCKTRNKIVAEYSLQNVPVPIGISEYELVKTLPKELQTNLPTIEQIEAGFAD